MFDDMSRDDLRMYLSGTYMRHSDRILYVMDIREGEDDTFVAETTQPCVPILELKPYFPESFVINGRNRGVDVITSIRTSSRNYKKSFSISGDPNIMERKLTDMYKGLDIVPFSTAKEELESSNSGTLAFGPSHKYHLSKFEDFTTILLYYLGNPVGYLEDNTLMILKQHPDYVRERVIKELGDTHVIVRQED